MESTNEPETAVKDVEISIQHVPEKANINTTLWTVMLIFGTIAYGSYAVLVHLCEKDGKIMFNSTSVVFVTELVKFLISLYLFVPEASKTKSSLEAQKYSYYLLFMVPALLYFVNNNITIHMQLYMDPATYQLLSNMKIVTTAVMYRLILKRRLSTMEWFAVSLLALAGGVHSFLHLPGTPLVKTGITSVELQQLYGFQKNGGHTHGGNMHISFTGLVMVGITCLNSGLSGVFTEYLLKKDYQISIYLQQVLLYVFGGAINFGCWLWSEYSFEKVLTQNVSKMAKDSSMVSFLLFIFLFTIEGRFNLFRGYSMMTWIIVTSQAVNGMIMASVLKHGTSITRLFIMSSSMIVTTLLSVVIFHTELNLYFVFSLIIIILALYLYQRK